MRSVIAMGLLAALAGCPDKTDYNTSSETGTPDSETATVDTDTGTEPTTDSRCDYDDAGNVVICKLTGVLTEDTTLTADKPWLLVGGVFVGDDVNPTVLTIEPGTTIYGDTVTRGFLVVRRHSKIEAVGTPEAPIVFTSSKLPDDRTRSDWGGVVINGLAPLNTCDTAPPDNVPATGCEAFGEGATGYYGGSDAADDSGTLSYVRVEFGGYPVTPADELNGIAFQGVGNGTQVDHIHIHMGGDDAIEFFGGTVDVKYVLLTGALDDSFDWTSGWSGRAQFVVSQQYPDTGDNGIEADNSATNHDFLPRSSPTLSNFTIVGAAALSANNGGLLRVGTAAEMHSMVFTGWDGAGSFCVDVNDAATFVQAAAGELAFHSSVVDCTVNFPVTEVDPDTTAGVYDNDASNLQADPLLADPFNVTAPDFAPGAGSPALTGGTVPVDPFFDAATFRGAVDPANDWVAAGIASGWIAISNTP